MINENIRDILQSVATTVSICAVVPLAISPWRDVLKKRRHQNAVANASNVCITGHVFPASLRSSNSNTYWGCFNQRKDAADLFADTGHPRHFLKDEEVIRFADGTEVAVSIQWSKNNIQPFMQKTRELKFDIKRVA